MPKANLATESTTKQANKSTTKPKAEYLSKLSDEPAGGVVHEIPPDLKDALIADAKILANWNGLTPLARNEWICWIISVKKPATRQNHIKRICEELLEGKRRPCCWAGCFHR